MAEKRPKVKKYSNRMLSCPVNQTRIEKYFQSVPNSIRFEHNNSNWSAQADHTKTPDLNKSVIDLTEDSLIKRKQSVCCVSMKNPRARSRKPVCPEYKIIEGTTFAVDAFKFNYISGVTHYFLTHFHSDHYIGLTKKFEKPIYCSEVTAKLINVFIGIKKQYIISLPLNETIIINDVETTALDANHCPGAVMFLYKFSNGSCTLHTGDFRASPEMESEPCFWNNFIDTLYLDTTYLTSKYNFKPQCDSINDVIEAVRQFERKHIGDRILYICGSYVIGKEKVWTKIAETFNFSVWTDSKRQKALEAINDDNMLQHLVPNPQKANIHVIPMGSITYQKLVEYLAEYSDSFDIVLAFRPSGWKHNSKPQYRGKINIVDVEYSEHSSYAELRRFVAFAQPRKIISTVPIGTDLSKTPEIPAKWFENEVRCRRKECQLSITPYLKQNKWHHRDNVHNDNCIWLGSNLSTSDSLIILPDIKLESIDLVSE